MILELFSNEVLDPEQVSHSGVYQMEALLKWLEYHHEQFYPKMAQHKLNQFFLIVKEGHQLQYKLSAQKFGEFLMKIEAVGKDTNSI